MIPLFEDDITFNGDGHAAVGKLSVGKRRAAPRRMQVDLQQFFAPDRARSQLGRLHPRPCATRPGRDAAFRGRVRRALVRALDARQSPMQTFSVNSAERDCRRPEGANPYIVTLGLNELARHWY